MRFIPSPLPGVVTVELEPAEDDRGFFARSFCAAEFASAGIALQPQQANISHNADALTLRGMHYQAAPHGEPKLVQCVRGRIFDVAVDLRRASPSYRQWFGLELAPDLRRMLFVPDGCAHGFLTLEADSDVLYLMGQSFVPEAARGVRWNDPAFGIVWPAEPQRISSRDAAYPHFTP
ncbi:MAG: dTDP-4-dehydrorhamnose 3,5-epimerase family protein [Pseudolabrys sp.]|nr:dTDP-4-dehydrorhamnose 3,5-epimerase family protein [Pseudolabrys sp.]